MADDPEAPGNRDDVVSGFTRMNIREWAKTRQIQELARIAKIAKSSPSQVLLGTGVGKKTIGGYARAFGYASTDAYRAAAWEWWRTEGGLSPTVERPPTEAMKQAIELVLTMGQGTREQIDTILVAYSHARFHERDVAWWTQTLLAELALDKEALREDRAIRQQINETQREVRAAHEARKPKPASPSKKRKAS